MFPRDVSLRRSRFPLLRCFCLALLAALGFADLLVAAEPRPPNVVVFLSDDQGWGDFSLTGNGDLATPHIDSLARDGAWFDRFYVCPVCSPTRAEFLTGRFHQRSGVYSTSAGGERMDLDEETIADVFRAAGYATGCFGKWHNGMQFPYHPLGRGFDTFYGFCSGHWGHYFDEMLERDGALVIGKGFVVDDCTTEAMAFMEANREKPFFAYVPYNTPHSPMQVPDAYWERFKDKELRFKHRDPKKEKDLHKRCALAMCENIDWNVGRVLKKLEELELEENTIVMYFTDNGPNGSRWNGDMEGRKGSTSEGGVRTPLVIRWPAGIEPGTRVMPITSVLDLLPTLKDLAGIEGDPKQPLDGVSLKPLLTGEGEVPDKDRIIYNAWKGRIGVRTQTHRLDDKGRLFDMVKDPGQRQNIAGRKPVLTARLKKLQAAHGASMKVILGTDERGFVIGHPGMKWTQVPARDGVAHGGVKRSNKFPNCSFFENWKTADDKVAWEVEVAEAGRFGVTMYYTCPEGDEGAAVVLSCQESETRATITRAFDPPLRGAADDRSLRMESYVKDWAVLDLGELTLQAGKGTMTLQAETVPGDSVMDFRLLMLERLEE